MHKFTRSFLTEWRKLGLPFADKTFVIAISGGADSVSLALVLNELRNAKKLNLRFVLAHFNHNLRGVESVKDERFVKKLAEKFEFELLIAVQDEAFKIENQKGNLEQNARVARYAFLVRIAKSLDADGILTAHTLNDQAETFLLNLIRGSGLDGLGGMKPIRNHKSEIENQRSDNGLKIQNSKSEIRLIRPLLRWAKREDTENFCHLNEIEFRSDSMNDDLAFKRVRVRKVLLPLLTDFNPKIIETLGKTAELLRDDAELISHSINFGSKSGADDESENFFEASEANKTGEYLSLKDLKNVFPAMRRFIVRQWLKNRRGDSRKLSIEHFEAVENLMLSRKSGRLIELPGGEIIQKKDGKLFYKKTEVEKS